MDLPPRQTPSRCCRRCGNTEPVHNRSTNDNAVYRWLVVGYRPDRYTGQGCTSGTTTVGIASTSSREGRLSTLDLIEIHGLRLRCILGVSSEERRDRQDVVIDLTVGTDATGAAKDDSVASVWNYRTATKAVIAHVESSAYYTVEKLAG